MYDRNAKEVITIKKLLDPRGWALSLVVLVLACWGFYASVRATVRVVVLHPVIGRAVMWAAGLALGFGLLLLALKPKSSVSPHNKSRLKGRHDLVRELDEEWEQLWESGKWFEFFLARGGDKQGKSKTKTRFFAKRLAVLGAWCQRFLLGPLFGAAGVAVMVLFCTFGWLYDKLEPLVSRTKAAWRKQRQG